jgi:hypothetical protein
MVTFFFVLIVGGGGAFFLKQHFDKKREKSEREKNVYEERKTREMRHLVVKEKQREVQSSQNDPDARERRKIEISFERAIVRVRSLIQHDEYGSALKILATLNMDKLTDPQRQQANALHKQIHTRAQAKFVKMKERAADRAGAEDYDGAIQIVRKADAFGIPEISNEVSTLALNYQKMKSLGKLGNQIQTFAIIEEQLNPSLSTFDYAAAADTIERLAPVTDYMLFKEDLIGIKEDFDLVEKTWVEFRNAMSSRVGTVEMFGIKRGTIKAVDGHGLTLVTPDGDVMLTRKEMQPAWIKAKAEITKEKAPEAHYGLGVMFLHKGKDKHARSIFSQHGDAQQKAERHLRWLGWRDEVRAMEVYKTLVAASQEKAIRRVPKIAAEFEVRFGNTRLFGQESAKIRQMVETATQILAENKKKATAIIAKLANYEEDARVKLADWYEGRKKAVEKQYQKELHDDFRYVKGATYSYGKEREGGNMRANLEVVLRALAEVRGGGKDVSPARRKLIEKDKRYLEKGVRNASMNRESNANLVKRKRIQLSDNIKNERIRLERRLKAGELVSDDEIEKKFDVLD